MPFCHDHVQVQLLITVTNTLIIAMVVQNTFASNEPQLAGQVNTRKLAPAAVQDGVTT